MSRYLFAISRDGFLLSAFSKVHAHHGTPYVASMAQTAFMLGAIGAVALLGQDPMTVVFAWCSALATMGILLLQAAVSVAVVVFFWRNRSAQASAWSRLVAPAISALGMAGVLAMVVRHLAVLSGTESSAIYALPWILAGAVACGLLYAFYLAQAQPSRYARLREVFEHVA